MPEKPTRPYPESQEPTLLALAAVGLIATGAFQLYGLASVLLTRLAELPDRLSPGGLGL